LWSPTMHSPNWSGAVLIQGKGEAGNEPFDSVWATWVVPKLKILKIPKGESGEWRSASWVGLDGGEHGWSKDVLQAGIKQCVTLEKDGTITEDHHAFYGWDPGNGSNTYTVKGFPVDAGDLIQVKVQYLNNRGFARFVNHTKKVEISEWIPKPVNVGFKGDTAEWIVERPFKGPDQQYYQLADFGVMEFVHAGGLATNYAHIGPALGDLCIMCSDENGENLIAEAGMPDDRSVRITWKSSH